MGHDIAVCVKVENSFGVVCLDKKIHCATCKHGTTTCKHVKHLKEAVSSDHDTNLSRLELFSDFISRSQLGKSGQQEIKVQKTSCISTLSTPFNLTSQLKASIRMHPIERFQIKQNVAHLTPVFSSSTPCPLCDSTDCWGNEALVTCVTLIMSTQVYKARGTGTHCTYVLTLKCYNFSILQRMQQ